MRIDGEDLPAVMSHGVTQLPEHELEGVGFRDSMAVQKVMHRPVADHIGQTVRHFEAPLAEGAFLPASGEAQTRFVNHLQCDPRLRFGTFLTSPVPENIPGSQSQMFGNQQPDTDQVA